MSEYDGLPTAPCGISVQPIMTLKLDECLSRGQHVEGPGPSESCTCTPAAGGVIWARVMDLG